MIIAVVGAQYGSEGKGVVVHKLATERPFDLHVRTGGPNAGHSFVHEGKPYTVQCIPVGFVDRNSRLILGAGAVINPRILQREIVELERQGFEIRNRLFIDQNATVLSVQDEEAEGHTKGELHARIGSTGEGVGSARMRRIERVGSRLVRQNIDYFTNFGTILDTTELIYQFVRRNILLEGTQGSGLSLRSRY
jgi:adenylosuccinate synthase